jgi:hypothetical protein
MSSKYGETHDIFNTHHTETKAKLDALLAKNTEIEVNNDGVETLLTAGNVNHASIDAKVVACNTGACVVSSSVLPSGASDSTKQDEIKTLITATNSALAGVLTVSSPAISKLSDSPLSSQGILGQSTHTSSEIDVSGSRHLSLIGSSTNTIDSHELDLLVSNVSGGTFFKTSHSGYFMDGEFHLLIANHPYKYVKVQVKNNRVAATSDDFTVHLLSSN